METTGSANDKISELMNRCMEESLDRHIAEIPRLKTNPELQKIFTLGFWMGAADHGEFVNLMMEEYKNGVVQQETQSD